MLTLCLSITAAESQKQEPSVSERFGLNLANKNEAWYLEIQNPEMLAAFREICKTRDAFAKTIDQWSEAELGCFKALLEQEREFLKQSKTCNLDTIVANRSQILQATGAGLLFGGFIMAVTGMRISNHKEHETLIAQTLETPEFEQQLVANRVADVPGHVAEGKKLAALLKAISDINGRREWKSMLAALGFGAAGIGCFALDSYLAKRSLSEEIAKIIENINVALNLIAERTAK